MCAWSRSPATLAWGSTPAGGRPGPRRSARAPRFRPDSAGEGPRVPQGPPRVLHRARPNRRLHAGGPRRLQVGPGRDDDEQVRLLSWALQGPGGGRGAYRLLPEPGREGPLHPARRPGHLDVYGRPGIVQVARRLGSPPVNQVPPGALPVGRAPAGTRQLGVRPEDVQLDGPSGIEAFVARVGPRGAETVILLEVADVALHALLAGEAAAPRPGTVLFFGTDGHRLEA